MVQSLVNWALIRDSIGPIVNREYFFFRLSASQLPTKMTSPLEILENRFDREKPYLSNIFNPAVAGLAGFGFACFLNFAFKKPVWSGIQKHVIFSVVGASIGIVVDKKRDQHMADRDAVLRHYIQLHPEDFPARERKKYADVLELWSPIR